MIVAMLLGVWSSSLQRVREKTYTTIDLANLRQILKGSAIYNSDNNDHMAHPTWGSDLQGPDGWAYLTSNNGRVPGAGPVPGSCAGVDENSARFTNQLAFFKKGLVTQYLPDVKTAWCPKDVATRGSNKKLRTLWIGRAVKVSSYCWNGTIAGVVGRKGAALPPGETYRISDFKPTDWQTWEQNEANAFNFGDAAANPEDPLGGLSRRHAGVKSWLQLQTRRNLPGGAIVGTFDGSAHPVRWSRVYDLFSRKVDAPNEILNGPRY